MSYVGKVTEGCVTVALLYACNKVSWSDVWLLCICYYVFVS